MHGDVRRVVGMQTEVGDPQVVRWPEGMSADGGDPLHRAVAVIDDREAVDGLEPVVMFAEPVAVERARGALVDPVDAVVGLHGAPVASADSAPLSQSDEMVAQLFGRAIALAPIVEQIALDR